MTAEYKRFTTYLFIIKIVVSKSAWWLVRLRSGAVQATSLSKYMTVEAGRKILVI